MLLTDGKPETPEDFRALERFPDSVVAELKDCLPRFASPEAEAGAALDIRRWAAFALYRLEEEKPWPRNKPETKVARDKLVELADALDAAAIAILALPEDADCLPARELMAVDEGAAETKETLAQSLDRVVEAENSLTHFLRMVPKVAAAARAAAKRIEVKRGQVSDEILIEQVIDLADLYHKLTGFQPTRVVKSRHDYGRSETTGGFFEFASLALKRLWPKRRNFERPIRAALYGRKRA